ncbi:MAG: hypothetical protein JSR91_25665 [Proteobacteria bacterium]|nr:hypothetical protein [Pseudomonadota bacterium]
MNCTQNLRHPSPAMRQLVEEAQNQKLSNYAKVAFWEGPSKNDSNFSGATIVGNTILLLRRTPLEAFAADGSNFGNLDY